MHLVYFLINLFSSCIVYLTQLGGQALSYLKIPQDLMRRVSKTMLSPTLVAKFHELFAYRCLVLKNDPRCRRKICYVQINRCIECGGHIVTGFQAD